MILAPSLRNAAPFWISLLLVPLIWICAVAGGIWLLLVPLTAWHLFIWLDQALGLNTNNLDPATRPQALFWYRALTIVWPPLQAVTLFGMIYYATRAPHLSGLELWLLFLGMGILTGLVGINFAHELMHQSDRRERWLGDILLAMTLYSHFRSEHLLVHHPHVATPRDAVTARYNLGFHTHFFRCLRRCLVSAWRAETALLARKGLPWNHPRNPFLRYALLQSLALALALVLGGWLGLALFLWQAFIAVWQLELVNYIEHYGLTRKYLGNGRYEPVRPRHSWNAAHKASSWLLINLQRHSDHHTKPDRRFPLLQHHSEEAAPQLPYGYTTITLIALWPRAWRRLMNPRVLTWREMYYPEITNWHAYNKGQRPPEPDATPKP